LFSSSARRHAHSEYAVQQANGADVPCAGGAPRSGVILVAAPGGGRGPQVGPRLIGEPSYGMKAEQMTRHWELIEAFADAKRRNPAIIELVGAINAGDLRRAQVSPDAKAALIAGLSHQNAKIRWWCLQLMDHLADESYLEPMLSKLSDPVAKVRRHAVHALSCAACKPNRQALAIDIEEALRHTLETDPDVKVREEARQGLERLGVSLQ